MIHSILEPANIHYKSGYGIDEDDIEEEDDEDFQSIDEEQLLSFLNEYYIVNPKKLPKAEII